MSQISTNQPAPQSSTMLVVVAVALALVAAVLVNVYIEMVKNENEEKTFPVYRMTRSMSIGETLRREDVKMVAVPLQFQDTFPDALSSEADLQARLGEPLKMSVATNAVLLRMHFTGESEAGGAEPPRSGLRRVWLPVNSKNVPGGLEPGVWVDIDAAFNDGGAIPRILRVMENVQVVAVGNRTITDESRGGSRGQPRNFPGISIDVTPEVDLMLKQIQIVTPEFMLSLRNPADRDRVTFTSLGINPEVIALINKRLPQTTAP